MFTGLVEATGILKAKNNNGKATKLIISSPLPEKEIAIGDSIAVNGTCLTVEQKNNGELHFHVLNETMHKTNLSSVNIGSKVNLERALAIGSRLGGHLVSGHIDTIAKIKSIQQRANDICLTIELPEELRPYVIYKGSIAINGISLTIADLSAHDFSVCLIPHTWNATNLCQASPGDTVNLEGDVIGKYVAHQLQIKKDPITMATLREAGF